MTLISRTPRPTPATLSRSYSPTTPNGSGTHSEHLRDPTDPFCPTDYLDACQTGGWVRIDAQYASADYDIVLALSVYDGDDGGPTTITTYWTDWGDNYARAYAFHGHPIPPPRQTPTTDTHWTTSSTTFDTYLTVVYTEGQTDRPMGYKLPPTLIAHNLRPRPHGMRHHPHPTL